MDHIEFLIEDQSGAKMLQSLLHKMIPSSCSYQIHSYKGIGRIPQGLKTNPAEASHRTLLNDLPRLLNGFGKTFHGYGEHYHAALVVICDLDNKDKSTFEQELLSLLHRCEIQPNTKFCLAIEEGEAWFLGDIDAIAQAYPKYDSEKYKRYSQDSICGTWEVLADMVFPGGNIALKNKGFPAVGYEKTVWAEKITPFMDIDKNRSPSFCNFRDTVRALFR